MRNLNSDEVTLSEDVDSERYLPPVRKESCTLPTPLMKTLARSRQTVSATSPDWKWTCKSPFGMRRI